MIHIKRASDLPPSVREKMAQERPRKPRKPRGPKLVPKPVLEARSWKFVISSYLPPSLNELLAANRWERSMMKKFCHNLVYVYSNVPKADSKRTVIITLTRSGHRKKLDPDNAKKLLLDSLVKNGLLVDDAEEWCSCPDPVQVKGATCSTTIELREISDEA